MASVHQPNLYRKSLLNFKSRIFRGFIALWMLLFQFVISIWLKGNIRFRKSQSYSIRSKTCLLCFGHNKNHETLWNFTCTRCFLCVLRFSKAIHFTYRICILLLISFSSFRATLAFPCFRLFCPVQITTYFNRFTLVLAAFYFIIIARCLTNVMRCCMACTVQIVHMRMERWRDEDEAIKNPFANGLFIFFITFAIRKTKCEHTSNFMAFFVFSSVSFYPLSERPFFVVN